MRLDKGENSATAVWGFRKSRIKSERQKKAKWSTLGHNRGAFVVSDFRPASAYTSEPIPGRGRQLRHFGSEPMCLLFTTILTMAACEYS
jgi:hypothetical protein